MAIEFHWVGCHETPTTAVRLCFHCTTDETVTVTLNGETKTAEALTATNDGNVVIDFTGLSPDTVYDVTVAGYTGPYGVKARTWPTDSLRVVHFSCVSPGGHDGWGLQAAKKLPHVILANDDFPYTDSPSQSTYADTTGLVASADAPTDVTNFCMHHRRKMAKRGFQRLVATGANFLYMPGDHEWPYDNWDHDQSNTLSEFATQADCDACWDAGRQACEAYMIGNPANTDANTADKYPRIVGGAITVDSPSTPSSNYPALYFRVGNNACEIFMSDTISHRSPLNATDNINKTMLGTEQRAWIKAQVAASTAAFKLWVHGKYLYPLDDEPAAGDRYDKYSAERDDVVADIASHPCVITIAGDKHVPNIGVSESPDMCCICACPAGVNESNHVLTPGANTVHVAGYQSSERHRTYGYIELTTESCTAQMLRARNSAPVWTGHFTPDSNLPTYPRARVG